LDQTLNLYVTLAEIGGVFVGFGALISITSKDQAPPARIALIRAAVTIGLVVTVAALLPLILSRYDVDEQALWRISSLVFLLLSWTVIGLAVRSRGNREVIQAQALRHPRASAFFWLALELPVQVPLILAVLGIAPDLGEAFYTTALVFNLFQAAFVLAQFVYDRP
jgi:succinate dehydrogenase hydrophobic anchor subunit